MEPIKMSKSLFIEKIVKCLNNRNMNLFEYLKELHYDELHIKYYPDAERADRIYSKHIKEAKKLYREQL